MNLLLAIAIFLITLILHADAPMAEVRVLQSDANWPEAGSWKVAFTINDDGTKYCTAAGIAANKEQVQIVSISYSKTTPIATAIYIWLPEFTRSITKIKIEDQLIRIEYSSQYGFYAGSLNGLERFLIAFFEKLSSSGNSIRWSVNDAVFPVSRSLHINWLICMAYLIE